ncbi:MAG: TerC family protein [Planctomycetes bacterium]|nr:TerC family protein [Planctomycetota bacterium]
MSLDWQFITSVLQIFVIDVVLSGDNAVVIAMAAHRLPQRQRRLAILAGAGGAIVLRVLFTYVLAQLLGVPLLRFAGGLVLVWIAMKLLFDEADDEGHKVREGGSLLQAIWIIVMADFVMSLDNMLAVGGASEGHLTLILFGLLLSIAIIMSCSALIADWMNRFPVLVLLGAVVLAWTAAEMMIEDAKVAEFLVTRGQLCVDKAWHDDFGGARESATSRMLNKHEEPKQWWLQWQDRLIHRHWIGWTVVLSIVGIVIIVPRVWNAAVRRRRSGEPAETVSRDPLPPNLAE